MSERRVLGDRGEDLAVDALRAAGLRILERNWRCAIGEIDVIARDAGTVVFCEVKTRTGTRFGAPVEAVTPAKVRRYRRLACRWLAERRPGASGIRFDVVTVDCPPGRPPTVVHLPGVF